jgi:hypothetical protein
MLGFKKSFKKIVSDVASENRTALETRARQANWLAHANPKQAKQFFRIKQRAVSTLFSHPEFRPEIEGVEWTRTDLLLSIRLVGWGRLHIPVSTLTPEALSYVVTVRVPHIPKSRPPVQHPLNRLSVA